MDLFMVGGQKQGLPISPISLGIAGAALLGIYFLSKAFSV